MLSLSKCEADSGRGSPRMDRVRKRLSQDDAQVPSKLTASFYTSPRPHPALTI